MKGFLYKRDSVTRFLTLFSLKILTTLGPLFTVYAQVFLNMDGLDFAGDICVGKKLGRCPNEESSFVLSPILRSQAPQYMSSTLQLTTFSEVFSRILVKVSKNTFDYFCSRF